MEVTVQLQQGKMEILFDIVTKFMVQMNKM